MKKSIGLLFLFAFIIQFSSQAQTSGREIGLKVRNLNSMSFLFKKQKSDVKYRRYSAFINSSIVSSSNLSSNVATTGVYIGFERRKYISDKMEFIHGFNPGIYLGITGFDWTPSTYGGFSLGYIIGFQYHINEEFALGAEMLPTLGVHSTFDENPNLRASFNFNQSAGLFLIYKFNKR